MTLMLVTMAGLILLVIPAFRFFRWLPRWLIRKLFRVQPRGLLRRLDRQVDALLHVMGERMERPWMTEELQVVAGLSEGAVEQFLARARARKLVRREWQTHPVTEEPIHAALLTTRGVRLFGMYAPDDMDSLPTPDEAPLKEVLLPEPDDVSTRLVEDQVPALSPAPATPRQPRGFRHARR